MSGLKLVSLDVVGGGQTRRDAFKPSRKHIPAVKRDIFLGRRRCNGHFPVSAKQLACGPRSEQAERDQTADTEDETQTQSDASRTGTETPGRVLTRLALFGLWRD